MKYGTFSPFFFSVLGGLREHFSPVICLRLSHLQLRTFTPWERVSNCFTVTFKGKNCRNSFRHTHMGKHLQWSTAKLTQLAVSEGRRTALVRLSAIQRTRLQPLYAIVIFHPFNSFVTTPIQNRSIWKQVNTFSRKCFRTVSLQNLHLKFFLLSVVCDTQLLFYHFLPQLDKNFNFDIFFSQRWYIKTTKTGITGKGIT